MESGFLEIQSEEVDVLMNQIKDEHQIANNESFKNLGLIFNTKSLWINYKRYHLKVYIDIFENKSKAVSVLKDILISKLLSTDNYFTYIIPCKNFHNLAVQTYFYETNLKKILESKLSLSIEHVQFFIYSIIYKMYYMHSKNIIHRCINPENIFVNSSEDFKLVNFENSVIENEKRFKLRPSLYEVKFMAPEEFINRKNIGKASDIWSVGCVLLDLLFKNSISSNNSNKHFYEVFNTQGDFDIYIVNQFNLFSSSFKNDENYDHAKDLALKILRFNPEERITCLDVFRHKFFNEIHDENDVLSLIDDKRISCEYTRMKFDELKNFIFELVSEY